MVKELEMPLIELPYGGRDSTTSSGNVEFDSDMIKAHLETQPDRGIPIGNRNTIYIDHTVQNGLDYWLRTHCTRQAVKFFQKALFATGDFRTKQVLQ